MPNQVDPEVQEFAVGMMMDYKGCALSGFQDNMADPTMIGRNPTSYASIAQVVTNAAKRSGHSF